MFSNQMPAESVLTNSCRDNSMRWARVILSHNAVPYSDTVLGGRKNLSGSSGASQSMSTIGAYDFLTEPLSNRSENSSRVGAVISGLPSRPFVDDVPKVNAA